MSWSLSNWPPKDPELIDAALLSAGKALYLSNAFEAKCSFVLRFLRLSKIYGDAPEASYTDSLAAIIKDKLLHGTLSEIAHLFPITAADADALDKARQARNFIAHEGALPGYVWSIASPHVYEHLKSLRTAVGDLAAGDHIVSKWSYMIEENDTPGTAMADYPARVDKWVFGWCDER